MNFLEKFAKNDNYTELFQIVFYFFLGLIFGANLTNLKYLIIYILVYEIIFYILTNGAKPYWRLTFRIVVNCGYFLGVVLGNWLVLGETGLEKIIHDSNEKPKLRGASRIVSKFFHKDR